MSLLCHYNNLPAPCLKQATATLQGHEEPCAESCTQQQTVVGGHDAGEEGNLNLDEAPCLTHVDVALQN